MKKKGLAMFALAAVMSLGRLESLRLRQRLVTGGQQLGYYNNNGSKVTNAWRQAQDGTWRYLESSGAMATNKWVDNDDYYVDASGIMITNKWLQVANSRKAPVTTGIISETMASAPKISGYRSTASIIILETAVLWRPAGSWMICTTAMILALW